MPSAVIVHDLDHMLEVLEAADELMVPVILRSHPDVGVALGPAVFWAMAGEAKAAYPDVTARFVFDCADMPGLALTAFDAGVEVVRISGEAREQIADVARQLGAHLDDGPAEALDLDHAGGAELRDWLSPA